VIGIERFNGGGEYGSKSNGIEDATKTLPRARSTMSGIALTKGCLSNGV
tara:strand:- start:211 stop:357 length:147 start_codon:yes stop_codon:yes gene_type:complete